MFDDGVLYILLRKDMDSLNHAGKMVAQGAHAANHAPAAIGSLAFGTALRTAWMAWEKSTPQGFGTTIVLGGIADVWDQFQRKPVRGLTIADIRVTVEAAVKVGYAGAIVNDPTYPLQDGKTLHGFPCDTCGWIFGSKAGLQHVLRDLVLHSVTADL